MPAEINTLILKLQVQQYQREMKRAREETRQMSGQVERLERRNKRLSRVNGRAKTSIDGLSGAVGKAGIAFAAFRGAQAMISFSKEAIMASATATETANKFGEVFKSVSTSANAAAAEYARSFDVANSTAQNLFASTGDLLVGFGFTESSALDLSKQVNTLAADLASFQNFEGGAERASQALTKALVGETEQAKALGIVIRQGTPEYKARTKAIMESQGVTILQAKALNNLEIAAKQSQKALGDYNRTSMSTANLTKAVTESKKGLTEAFGSALRAVLPINGVLLAQKQTYEGLAAALNEVSIAFGDAQITSKKDIFFMRAGLVSNLFMPNLDALEAGNRAEKDSLAIIKERNAARAKELELIRKATVERKAQARQDLIRRASAILSTEKELKARWKQSDAEAKEKRERDLAAQQKAKEAKATRRATVTDPIRAMKEQLFLQRLVNKGREKEAYILRAVWQASKGRVATEKDLRRVAVLSSRVYDAMNADGSNEENSRVSRSFRLAGAALEGSADAVRTITGGGATLDAKIENHTKKTAENTAKLNTRLVELAIKRAAAPANFRGR